MAVANPYTPNLAGNYENIQNALSQSATIAQQRGQAGGVAGPLNAALAPIAAQAKVQNEALLKYTIQDNLDRNQAAYQAQAEGKSLVTPEQGTQFEKSLGLTSGSVSSLIPDEGVWMTPQDKVKIGQTLEKQQTVEKLANQQKDPNVSNMVRLLGTSNDSEAQQLLARISTGMIKPEPYMDPTTNTIKYRDSMTKQPINLDTPGGMPTKYGTSPDAPNINDIPSLRKIDGKQADALQNAAKEAAADPGLKASAKTLDELDQVKKLVQANVPGSKINMGADTASAIGGVPGGKFSSILATQEGSDPSITGKLGQYFTTAVSGKLSDNNQTLLEKEIDIAKQAKQTELASALNEKVKTIKAQAPYASNDLISSQLGYQRYLQPITNTSTTQTGKKPDISDFKSAKDVKSAYQKGTINQVEAAKLLKLKFGYP